jgi:hypothetical protein
MKSASKDSLNPHFKSKYADLASVTDACRPHLSANGIAVVQVAGSAPGVGVRVTTWLLHSSGEYMKGRLDLPVAQNNAHGYGSALTYARRFALAAMTGIAPDEDDDGNAASAPVAGQVRAQPQASARTATDVVREKLAKVGITETQVVSAGVSPDDDSAVITFTKHKGKRLSQVDDRTVQWFLEKAEEKAQDTSDKWHAKNLAWLDAVRAEMDRRTGEVK